jgi:predicted negative regulator of RcsB-dependent stress response
MSGASSDQTLSEAYELIEAENHDQAQAILKPILEQEPDNVDAWWLYAHAVTDPETGRMALNQVLRLDSSYHEAHDLLTELDKNGPDTLETIETPPSLPEDGEMARIEADDMDGFSLDDTGPIFDDRRNSAETQQSGRSGLRTALMALIIIAILIVAVILLFNSVATSDIQSTAQQTPGATTVAQEAVPTVTAEVISLNAVPELEPLTDEVSNTITEQMADFKLIENGLGTKETSLGKTLLASICTTSSSLRQTLNDSMDTLAAVSEKIEDDIKAVGVALIDCDSDRLLRVIATTTEDALAYSSGKIDTNSYQARWIAAA